MGKPCPKKKKYLSQDTAQLVLDDIRARADKDRRKPREKNIYQCPHCGFWHLTKVENMYTGPGGRDG